MQEEGFAAPAAESVPLDALDAPEEHALMVALSRYPEVVELAAEHRAPQTAPASM